MLAVVVDDSRAMRKIIGGILRRLGFSVYEAENGQDALDLLADLPNVPDITLTDWNMPVMNGLEFIRKVRKTEGLRDMWLMMVTTESEQSQVVRALAAGANEYVIKPFTADAIEQKLSYLGLVAPATAQVSAQVSVPTA